MYMCICAYGGQRTSSDAVLRNTICFLWKKVSSWSWSSPIGPAWLTASPKGLLFLPSGIASMCHHVQRVLLGLGDQTKVLVLVKWAHFPSNHCPSLVFCLFFLFFHFRSFFPFFVFGFWDDVIYYTPQADLMLVILLSHLMRNKYILMTGRFLFFIL